MSAGVYEVQQRVLHLLELESVGCEPFEWVLGTELRSSVKTVCAFNQ